MYIKRLISERINECLRDFPVTLITGARQVGKTTLVSHFSKYHNYTYISFDDQNILKEAKTNLRAFILKYSSHVIFDEVQYIPEIFNEIEYIVNKTRLEKGNDVAKGMFILTGSQKFSLMKGVTESMAGRVAILEIEPLSQAELQNWESLPFEVDYKTLLNKESDRQITNDEIYESIVKGFYPGRWERKDNNVKDFYKNYLKTYIERDVSQILNINEKIKFNNFILLLACLTGKELIVDNLSKDVGVDNKTINSWLSILVTSNLITLVQPYFDCSIKKRIVKRNKIYFNDTGLVCHLLSINSVETFKLSPFKGFILETYVFNEIKKSYVNQNKEPKIYFYRDSNQNEIDFIIVNDGKINLIECKPGTKYSSLDVKAFNQLKSSMYRTNGKCIICTTNDSYQIQGDVGVYPIRVI